MHVILLRPGEGEIPLLTGLSGRGDAARCVLVAPRAGSGVDALAQVLGFDVVADAAAVRCPASALIVPAADPQVVAEASRLAAGREWTVVPANELLHHLDRDGSVGGSATADRDRILSEFPDSAAALIELAEGLEPAAMLMRLLELAVAQAAAGGGRMMLPDSSRRRLKSAAATGDVAGLPPEADAVDGPAGRAFASRHAELSFSGRQKADDPQGALLAVPLVRGPLAAGVIVLGLAAGDPLPDAIHLRAWEAFGRKCASILHRLLPDPPRGAALAELELRLRSSMRPEAGIEEILRGWTAALRASCRADAATLGVLRDDGSLATVSDSAPGLDSQAVRFEESAERVLATGHAFFMSELGDGRKGAGAGFAFPLGGVPMQGVLTLETALPGDADAYRRGCAPMLAMLAERVADLRRMVRRRDRAARSERVARLLIRRTRLRDDAGETRNEILAGIERLTGARRSLLLDRDAAGEFPAGTPLTRDDAEDGMLAALVERARDRGWSAIDLSADGRPGGDLDTILATVPSPGAEAPVLILHGKQRRHLLDVACFTEDDADVAAHLLSLLDAGAESIAPAGKSAETTVLAPRTAVTDSPVPAPDDAPASASEELPLTTLLQQEMDRSERYHVSFSLSLFRPAGSVWTPVHAQRAVNPLRELVRSSDIVIPLADGTLALVAPEETQSVSRLERRVAALLREVAGDEDLEILVGRVVHPGPHAAAAELFEAARRDLERSR